MEDDEINDEPDEAAAAAAAKAKPKPKAEPKDRTKLQAILGFVVVTLLAVGVGGGFGTQVAGHVEQIVVEREKAKPQAPAPKPVHYKGDLVLQQLDPVIVNLADPSSTWIRLETAIVFQNGAVENPAVTGAEIRGDILAYVRTMKLAQLEGASALEHMREDLNDRVATRTDGRVSELILETMIVQ